MSLYLVAGGAEIARRRKLVPKGQIVEAWADLMVEDAFWIGEQTRAALDAVGDPIPVQLVLPTEVVSVFYGPQLADIDSLPTEESLKSRVLSAHGIAVAWVTLDRAGQRVSYEPTSHEDPVFHLRRIGGGPVHLWRLFRTRKEAIDYLGDAYGQDSEGHDWAQALAADDFRVLLDRHGRRTT